MAKENIGIDLGTANVLVYTTHKGVVLNEPAVIALNTDTDEVLAVGEEARLMIGRTPGNITAIKPLKGGVISDYNLTEKMLKYFINKACGNKPFFKPTIMICVPSGVTEVEKRAAKEAATQAGGKEAFLIEEPIAAAIGAGIDISKPSGVMIIDIGGGTTDIAVISLGTIVLSTSVKVAGDTFDESIIRYIRKKHNLLIGERTAEELKLGIGTACYGDENDAMTCRGRDLVTGFPRTITVNGKDMEEALREPLETICDSLHNILEQTPPELSADIILHGIILTGGGAHLKCIDQLIEEKTEIKVIIAEEPENCVAIGTGKSLETLDFFEKSAINKKRSFF